MIASDLQSKIKPLKPEKRGSYANGYRATNVYKISTRTWNRLYKTHKGRALSGYGFVWESRSRGVFFIFVYTQGGPFYLAYHGTHVFTYILLILVIFIFLRFCFMSICFKLAFKKISTKTSLLSCSLKF